MIRKHSILALLMATTLAGSVFAGCGTKADSTSSSTSKGQSLTFSVLDDVPTLDPQLQNSMASAEVNDEISEGLVRLHDGKVQPGMAKTWDISADGKTYTFHLRDAKWSDGKPVTAQDFEYGIKRLLNPKLASSYAFAGYNILNGEEYNTGKITDPNQVGVKAIDDKTLEIKLKAPTAYFLAYSSSDCFHASRQDLVEKYGTKFGTDASSNVYNGPFILKEWKSQNSLTLEKNPNYWDKDSVKLQTVTVLVVKDGQTALNMYNSGDLDFVTIPTESVESYIKSGKAKVYMTGADDWMRLNLNAAGKPWLNNKNFRKALNYAINREDYVKTATKGLFFPATRLVLPMVTGANGGKYTDECPIDTYPVKGDKAKAKEYLAKAMSELGITDAKKMTLELKTSDDENSKKMAEVLQDQLSTNLGITVTIKMVTYKQKLDDDTKKQYEAVYNGWMPDYDDPMTYMELFEGNNSQNSTGYKNPEYDKLVEAARIETDKVKRQQELWDAEKILVDDCPFIPLQFRQSAWLCKDNLKGLVRPFVGSDIDFTYAYFK